MNVCSTAGSSAKEAWGPKKEYSSSMTMMRSARSSVPCCAVAAGASMSLATDKAFVLGTIHKPFDISLLLDTVTGVLQSTSDLLQAPDCPPQGSLDRDTPN
jgi:hypothetical protein